MSAAAATPAFVVNVTGSAVLSVRELAERFGRRFGVPPSFVGQERVDAILSNTDRMQRLFAAPAATLEEMIERVAAWVERGAPVLGRSTHFEARDGRF